MTMQSKENSMKLIESVGRNMTTVVRRAPGWSHGIVLILAAVILGIFLLREVIIPIAGNAERIKALEAEVLHCKETHIMQKETIEMLKQRVSNLETEIAIRPK